MLELNVIMSLMVHSAVLARTAPVTRTGESRNALLSVRIPSSLSTLRVTLPETLLDFKETLSSIRK